MKRILAVLLFMPMSGAIANAQKDFSLNRVDVANFLVLTEDTASHPPPILTVEPDNGHKSDSHIMTEDAYDFPIKPGMPKWKAMANHSDRVAACQVPENVLKVMSTAGLVETVMTYPHYGDMFLYNTYEQGFARVSARFNGFSELYKRKDAGAVLLAKYRAMEPAKKQQAFTLAFIYIEILLSQKPILDNLTVRQRQELREVALEKYNAKKTMSDYGQDSLNVTLSLANNATSRWCSLDYNTTVYTPRWTPVGAEERTTEMSDTQIGNLDEYALTNFPMATLERRSSRRYNCHSYAWHDQSAYNTKWIYRPEQYDYWLDGSYLRWYGPNAPSGMKLDYSYDDHSAIFLSGANPADFPGASMCRSKWGAGPLMRHPCDYSPYNPYYIIPYVLN